MTPETMPWYKSRVLLGVLLSAVLKALVLLGVTGELAADQQAEWLDVIVLLSSFIGDAIAAHARIAQTAAPAITATKGSNTDG